MICTSLPAATPATALAADLPAAAGFAAGAFLAGAAFAAAALGAAALGAAFAAGFLGVVAMGSDSLRILERFGAGDDLDQLLGDLRLA